MPFLVEYFRPQIRHLYNITIYSHCYQAASLKTCEPWTAHLRRFPEFWAILGEDDRMVTQRVQSFPSHIFAWIWNLILTTLSIWEKESPHYRFIDCPRGDAVPFPTQMSRHKEKVKILKDTWLAALAAFASCQRKHLCCSRNHGNLKLPLQNGWISESLHRPPEGISTIREATRHNWRMKIVDRSLTLITKLLTCTPV